MIVPPRRRTIVIGALALVGCSREPSSGRPDSAAGAPADTAAVPRAAAAPPAWGGAYRLRGTLEGSRQASGTLTLRPLASGAPEYAAAQERVRQTYPSYAGPFFGAELSLAAGADSVRGAFSCAHGPATPPALVCHPTAPLPGLENATLVMQPAGRAVLTGSHGEGVSVEYGRLAWTASAP